MYDPGDNGDSYVQMLLSLLPEEVQWALARQHAARAEQANSQRAIDIVNGQGGFHPRGPMTPVQGEGIYGGRLTPQMMPGVFSPGGREPDEAVWAHNRRATAGMPRNMGGFRHFSGDYSGHGGYG